MKKLYFVRHGLTEMNVSGHFSGSTETNLTEVGRKQAKLAGKHAKNLGIDYIISSPQSRALETAKIIAKEIGYPVNNIHTNSLLVERHFGVMEGQPWNPDLDYDGIADVETSDTLINRAKLALDFLHTVEANNILVVAHGAIGRAIRHHILEDFPFEKFHKIENAEIVQWI
jgi:uncharacterized phosphatase